MWIIRKLPEDMEDILKSEKHKIFRNGWPYYISLLPLASIKSGLWMLCGAYTSGAWICDTRDSYIPLKGPSNYLYHLSLCKAEQFLWGLMAWFDELGSLHCCECKVSSQSSDSGYLSMVVIYDWEKYPIIHKRKTLADKTKCDTLLYRWGPQRPLFYDLVWIYFEN